VPISENRQKPVRLEAVDGQLVAAAADRFVLGVSRADYSGEAFTVVIAASDAKALVKMAKTLKRDEASREVTVEVVGAGAQVSTPFLGRIGVVAQRFSFTISCRVFGSTA
jgi:hypothetical protein